MADLTITASSVQPASGNTQYQQGTAGVAITAGEVVYLNTTDNEWYLAQCDGTAAEAGADGLAIAVCDAAASQPFMYLQLGDVDLGSILTAGTTYVLSDVAGKIQPTADFITTGWYLSYIGYAKDSDTMTLLCKTVEATGVQIP